jgi:hypothetical protein
MGSAPRAFLISHSALTALSISQRYQTRPIFRFLGGDNQILQEKLVQEQLNNVVGLYVDPSAHAVVLSVDEKSEIPALDRAQPGLPMKPRRAG